MTPPLTRTRPDVVAFDVDDTLLDLAPVRATLGSDLAGAVDPLLDLPPR